MKIVFSERGWTHYLHWQTADVKLFVRINGLIGECTRDPFCGTGKPEPLSGNLAGWWSRRITLEHRLVYRVTGTGDAQSIAIAACRYQY